MSKYFGTPGIQTETAENVGIMMIIFSWIYFQRSDGNLNLWVSGFPLSSDFNQSLESPPMS